MPRTAKNQLTIMPVEGTDLFLLSGYCNGERVRLKRRDLAELEATRAKMEAGAAAQAEFNRSRPLQLFTRLTPEQNGIAESLFREFGHLPQPLAEYIRAGMATIGTGQLTPVADALHEWEVYMEVEQQLKKCSMARNLQYTKMYIKDFKPAFVSDITLLKVREFSSISKIQARHGGHASIYSRISRFASLRTFLSFCKRAGYITVNPLDGVDTKNDLKLAKKRTKAVTIFTPEQCKALLDAAIEHDPRFVPFVVLSCWTFARQTEVLKMTTANVHLDVPVPYVEPASDKLGTPNERSTDLPPNMVPLLRECIKTGLWPEGEPVHYTVNGFRDLRVKAGFLELEEPNRKGFCRVRKSSWEANALRHTGISMLYQKYAAMAERGEFKEGASIGAAVTRQAGNSQDVMFKHYVRRITPAQAEAFYKITACLKKEVAQDSAQNVA